MGTSELDQVRALLLRLKQRLAAGEITREAYRELAEDVTAGLTSADRSALGLTPTPTPRPGQRGHSVRFGPSGRVTEPKRMSAAHLDIGTLVMDRWRILRELGRGGFATVYEADDVVLKTPVAIKLLDPAMVVDEGLLKRFRHEVVTMRTIRHPRVVPVFEYREDLARGLALISMELVKGGCIQDLIDEARQASRAVPAVIAVAVLAQVLDALAVVHDRGVIHRDVSPANVLLARVDARILLSDSTADPSCQLIDFGIAGLAEGRGLTSGPRVRGNTAYAAPEALGGEEPLTAAADVYGAGAIAYHLLTGIPPTGAFPDPAALRSDITPELKRLLLALLNRDAPLRPTAREALREASRLLESSRAAATQGTNAQSAAAGKAERATAGPVSPESLPAAGTPEAPPSTRARQRTGKIPGAALRSRPDDIGGPRLVCPISGIMDWTYLASGGWAHVYVSANRKLALKIARPELAAEYADLTERFSREPRILKELREASPANDDYPAVHDVGDLTGVPFFTMEYVPGADLGDILAAYGSLPDVGLVLRILAHLMRMLAPLHARGVVYRDLTPENVIFHRFDPQAFSRADGIAVLARLGIRLIDFNSIVAVDAPENRSPASVHGKPRYISPEQWQLEPCSPASDVYQLGVVTYELVAGRTPFDADELQALMRAHLGTAPDLSPLEAALGGQNGGALIGAIRAMLAKQPSARPTIEDLDRQLFGGTALNPRLRQITHKFALRSEGVETTAPLPAEGEAQPTNRPPGIEGGPLEARLNAAFAQEQAARQRLSSALLKVDESGVQAAASALARILGERARLDEPLMEAEVWLAERARSRVTSAGSPGPPVSPTANAAVMPTEPGRQQATADGTSSGGEGHGTGPPHAAARGQAVPGQGPGAGQGAGARRAGQKPKAQEKVRQQPGAEGAQRAPAKESARRPFWNSNEVGCTIVAWEVSFLLIVPGSLAVLAGGLNLDLRSGGASWWGIAVAVIGLGLMTLLEWFILDRRFGADALKVSLVGSGILLAMGVPALVLGGFDSRAGAAFSVAFLMAPIWLAPLQLTWLRKKTGDSSGETV